MLSVINRLFSRKGSSAQVALGIEIAPQGVGFAVVSGRGQGVPIVNHCAFRPCAQGEWNAEIKAFCKEQGLKNPKTYVAFHQEFYNL